MCECVLKKRTHQLRGGVVFCIIIISERKLVVCEVGMLVCLSTALGAGSVLERTTTEEDLWFTLGGA